ncbi:hypothetical protein AB4Z46_18665 [Variovorax sp. M-6]|uniref:hypothetical protein n=1 Tax=Variovorax sp. M-6 TaxID=3233041 RepID=UPI003F94754F
MQAQASPVAMACCFQARASFFGGSGGRARALPVYALGSLVTVINADVERRMQAIWDAIASVRKALH